MIIRILSEGQYRLDSSHLDRLNDLDDRLVRAVAAGDNSQYLALFTQMLTLVRGTGTRIEAQEIVESDIVLPAPDTSLQEAQRLFTGEGLVRH